MGSLCFFYGFPGVVRGIWGEFFCVFLVVDGNIKRVRVNVVLKFFGLIVNECIRFWHYRRCDRVDTLL